MSSEQTKSLISHDVTMDLIRLTMLIYNYGKDFTFESYDVNFKGFIDRIINKYTDSDLLSFLRKSSLQDIQNNNDDIKLCDFINDPETVIQAGIILNHSKAQLCVVFRGSESMKDWYHDFQISKRLLHDNIKVHCGFYNQLHDTSVCDKMINRVKTILATYPDYQLYITGHSLGGALCTLFGYLLSHEIDNQVTVVSFASPRVGNSYWKKSFEKKSNLSHYRITNNRDIITATPSYNYRHVGTDIHVYDDCYKVASTDVKFCCNFSCIFANHWSISDHDCDLYYERIMKNKW
jgi:predicted lipase